MVQKINFQLYKKSEKYFWRKITVYLAEKILLFLPFADILTSENTNKRRLK